jgi:hypothetical protein
MTVCSMYCYADIFIKVRKFNCSEKLDYRLIYLNEEKGSLHHSLRGALRGPLVSVSVTRIDRGEYNETYISLHFVHAHYCS